MAQSAFPVKQTVIILVVVAVVAIAAAVLTAEHIGPVSLLIIAGIAALGGFGLYAWISSEARKIKSQSPPESSEDKQ